MRPEKFIDIYLCAVLVVDKMENTKEVQKVQEAQKKNIQDLCESMAFNARSFFQLLLAIEQLKRIRRPTADVTNTIKDLCRKVIHLRRQNAFSMQRIQENIDEFYDNDCKLPFSAFKNIVTGLKRRILEGTTPNIASEDESADEIIARLVNKGMLTLQGSEPAGVEDYDEDTGEREADDEEPAGKRRKLNTDGDTNW